MSIFPTVHNLLIACNHFRDVTERLAALWCQNNEVLHIWKIQLVWDKTWCEWACALACAFISKHEWVCVWVLAYISVCVFVCVHAQECWKAQQGILGCRQRQMCSFWIQEQEIGKLWIMQNRFNASAVMVKRAWCFKRASRSYTLINARNHFSK